MTDDQPIAVFDWFSNQFTARGRAEFAAEIGAHLTPLIQTWTSVLDLCCGAGAISFYLEDRGAKVTGVDLSPSLIGLARQEAAERGSESRFIQADVLSHHLGNNEYDLVVCLGNAVLDFPHREFSHFRENVFRALKPEGRLAIQFLDGLLRVKAMSAESEVVEQGATGQIVRRFREYDPLLGAYVVEYRHLETGEVYQYTGYVYTGPVIRAMLESRFGLERSIRLSVASFLDIYRRKSEDIE